MREILLPAIAVAAVAVALAVLAGTHRVLARMAVRNAFRRRSRLLIVTFGLLIGTMIVSSSLTVGDTLEYIFTGDGYDPPVPVDGRAPALQKAMPVRNGLTGSQAITVMGLDDAYESGFGDLVDAAGAAVGVASLPPD